LAISLVSVLVIVVTLVFIPVVVVSSVVFVFATRAQLAYDNRKSLPELFLERAELVCLVIQRLLLSDSSRSFSTRRNLLSFLFCLALREILLALLDP